MGRVRGPWEGGWSGRVMSPSHQWGVVGPSVAHVEADEGGAVGSPCLWLQLLPYRRGPRMGTLRPRNSGGPKLPLRGPFPRLRLLCQSGSGQSAPRAGAVHASDVHAWLPQSLPLPSPSIWSGVWGKEGHSHWDLATGGWQVLPLPLTELFVLSASLDL